MPFDAVVEVNGDDIVTCNPVVYDEPDIFGVAVIFNQKLCLRWGLISPRDMIAAWRATEIIRYYKVINEEVLANAFFASSRQPYTDKINEVESVKNAIGMDLYNSIMQKPIPEKIIQAILSEQLTDYPPDLFPITDEVRAGTIFWRQEFAEAGVEHPDDADIRKEAKRLIIKRHSNFLESYAVMRQMTLDSDMMRYVETALANIIDLGFDKKCHDRLLTALAGVIGELSMAEISRPSNEKLTDEQLVELQNISIEISADWLVKNPWNGIKYSKDLANKILRRYLMEIFEESVKNTIRSD